MIELNLHKNLKSSFGEMLLEVQITIPKEKLIAFYGKSGAGKTTILKIISGLIQPDKGSVTVGNEIWLDTNKKIDLSPQKRSIGFVFQEYTLFPNMSVKENLLFALTKGQDKKIIAELIDIVDLGDLQNRSPNTLSGGQKQRIALARALVQKPNILLLDEPLSAIDHEMRVKLQQYILRVHSEFKLTTILISHDISEIIKMSDYLYELDHGKIVNQGTPSDIFIQNKVNEEFQFIGEVLAIESFIITVLIGNNLIKVSAEPNLISNINIGEKVAISFNNFNPVISKID
ncbi:MAG: ATP-binding cassette domain-containing protein [Flavobacteriaceae bacterium]|nr:ATP-binding cassette domain-containing protein [Flavobacteriaceae bacterium]